MADVTLEEIRKDIVEGVGDPDFMEYLDSLIKEAREDPSLEANKDTLTAFLTTLYGIEPLSDEDYKRLIMLN